MSTTRQLGYIAVSRSIFEHPLFKNRPDWHVAWEKLIAAAAWKPQAHVGRWGSAHVERGQLAITQRALAVSWGWPSSTLRYFLDRLEQAKMIVQEVIRATINANDGIKNSQRITIITICNYDKFQPRGRIKINGFAQETAQGVAQESPELPLNCGEVKPNKLKQPRLKGKEGKASQQDFKPNHGVRSDDGRFVWWDYGTDEWTTYSGDYRQVRGSDIFPATREIRDTQTAGRGNWFVYLGEATRPKIGGTRRKTA